MNVICTRIKILLTYTVKFTHLRQQEYPVITLTLRPPQKKKYSNISILNCRIYEIKQIFVCEKSAYLAPFFSSSA